MITIIELAIFIMSLVWAVLIVGMLLFIKRIGLERQELEKIKEKIGRTEEAIKQINSSLRAIKSKV